jgi:hypothetical protein
MKSALSPQQILMRHLFETVGPDKTAVCVAYANAERDRVVDERAMSMVWRQNNMRRACGVT